MAIFNLTNTVVSGQLISSTHHNNVNSDANNTGDNVHPQYNSKFIDAQEFFLFGDFQDTNNIDYRLTRERFNENVHEFNRTSDTDYPSEYDDTNNDVSTVTIGETNDIKFSTLQVQFQRNAIDNIDIQIDASVLEVLTPTSVNEFYYQVFKLKTATYSNNDGYTQIGSDGSDITTTEDGSFRAITLGTAVDISTATAAEIIVVSVTMKNNLNGTTNEGIEMKARNLIVTPNYVNSN